MEFSGSWWCSCCCFKTVEFRWKSRHLLTAKVQITEEQYIKQLKAFTKIQFLLWMSEIHNENLIIGYGKNEREIGRRMRAYSRRRRNIEVEWPLGQRVPQFPLYSLSLKARSLPPLFIQSNTPIYYCSQGVRYTLICFTFD